MIFLLKCFQCMHCSVYYYELRLKIHVFLGNTVSTETLNYKTFNSQQHRLNLAKFLNPQYLFFEVLVK
jgi:hypothetical protein